MSSALLGAGDESETPMLRKPSQVYVDHYIARRGEPPSPRTAAVTPRGGQARRAARIFYQLDEACPAHYYPKLKTVNPIFMRAVCIILQAMLTATLSACAHN